MSLPINQKFVELAKGLHAAPAYIADVFGVNPSFIERLLAARGHRCAEGQSLKELVDEVYGNGVGNLMVELIDEEVFLK